MKHTIDDIDFKEKEYKKIILDFLRKKSKEWVSIKDITLATGLQQNWVEYSLRLLMKEYPCEVSLNEGKQAIYLFDIQQQAGDIGRRLRFFLDKIQWIVTGLIWLISEIALWIFVLICILVYVPSYFINAAAQSILNPILKYVIDFQAIEKQADKYSNDFFSAIVGKEFNESGGGLEYFFKPFNAKKQKPDRLFTERKLLQYASFRGGKLTHSEIIQLTGWDLHTAKLAATKMVGIYNGEIQISQAGVVEYIFEDLTQDQPGIMYIPKVWHSLEKYKVLTSLPSNAAFWKMMRVISLTALYHCIFTVTLLFFFIPEADSPSELFWSVFFLAMPLLLLLICYVIISLRYLVYQIQNVPIHKRNLFKRIIKHITEKRGDRVYLKDFEKENANTVKKYFLALEGSPKIDENEQTYFYFEEFALADYPMIEHYQKINLYDRFDGKSGLKWSTGENENRKLAYVDDYYYFEHKRNERSWLTFYHLPFDNAYKYFKIEAKFEVLKTEDPESYYGIIWDTTSDFNNYYEFFVSNAGGFEVSECVKGEAAYYRRETSEHILPQPAINTLTLEQYANTEGKLRWRFSINHHEVTDMNAQKTLGDRIGFVLGRKISVAIHELLVTESIPSEK